MRLRKRNNQGSTLLTVIICIAFIGILGAVMLSVTMTNLQMKMIESKSKENFYTCEMAMEEIRVGIQELTANAIQTVYKDQVFPNFTTYMKMTEADRNKEIQNMVAKALVPVLGNTEGISNPENLFTMEFSPDVELYRTYLSYPENTAVSALRLSTSKASYTLEEENILFSSSSILIKDIKIIYTKEDYQTSISSDIRITMPEFSFDQEGEEETSDLVQPFKDYVLVADGGIISENGTGTNNIQGSVYAGTNGITVKNSNVISGNHEVVINGENIVTRGNLTVSDTAKLTVGTTQPPVIWADNIRTSSDYSQSTTASTIMDIYGNCIIKDDLILDAANSDVTITGAYIGYTGLHTAEGSAIMVNGLGSDLNLQNLSSLILAGRAHVNVEDQNLGKDSDIMTGESVALKSNQRAYLLPGDFITNVLHNPVTEEDIRPEGSASPIVPNIDISNGEIDYETYTAGAYKIAAKQSITSGGMASTLRYYYLNFKSGIDADRYLKDFMAEKKSVLNNTLPFTMGNIKLPDSNYFSVGNLMSYPDRTDGLPKEVQLTPGLSTTLEPLYPDFKDQIIDEYVAGLTLGTGEFDAVLEGRKVSQLEGLYSKISHLLNLEGETLSFTEGDPVVASGIVGGGVTYITTGTALSTDHYILSKVSPFNNTNPVSEYIVVVNGDAVIENGAILNGILIASGNITIGEDAKINGMVISTGETADGDITVNDRVIVNGRLAAVNNIYLGTDGTFTTNETIETNSLAPLFLLEGTFLSNVLKNSNSTVHFNTSAADLADISISNMITYENWRKN
jgi:type II secretory pathway pseudopilin PulG